MIFTGEKLKPFLLKTRQRCLLPLLLFNLALEILSITTSQKQKERIQAGKKDMELSLSTAKMVLYIENPKDLNPES